MERAAGARIDAAADQEHDRRRAERDAREHVWLSKVDAARAVFIDSPGSGSAEQLWQSLVLGMYDRKPLRWTGMERGQFRNLILRRIDDPVRVANFLEFVTDAWSGLIHSRQFAVSPDNAPTVPRIRFLIDYRETFLNALENSDAFLCDRFKQRGKIGATNFGHSVSKFRATGMTYSEARDAALHDLGETIKLQAMHEAENLSDEAKEARMSPAEQVRYRQQRTTRQRNEVRAVQRSQFSFGTVTSGNRRTG